MMTHRQPRFKPYSSTAHAERAALVRIAAHRQHQQGDEVACSCGKRWPVGEDHP